MNDSKGHFEDAAKHKKNLVKLKNKFLLTKKGV